MHALHHQMGELRRPRLLIRAARLGMADYRRDRDLKRLLGAVPGPESSLAQLIAEETRMDAKRREGAAEYDLRRHLEIIIAMIAEAQMIPRVQDPAPAPMPRTAPETAARTAARTTPEARPAAAPLAAR
ncbi:hypothetical protein U879_02540 [Defluviimonas sp. 20V17]|uniref:Uncharacterized protein n=1 Tax=Allgaiera indica TaxID=765699 RepID=A0AAN4UTX8_9RHOB|nr:DUF6477 family protein [Allgaiera indica]KDB05216.1 hypothetical protein U879_02540 [Defluviimonas sp. 20V17]GHE04950.1 hypothetical protein GCM10008024_34060 [Allgaiera indica]SDX60088.1 hypothetical protein SAMN05444006_12126 [Allgaiera indica]